MKITQSKCPEKCHYSVLYPLPALNVEAGLSLLRVLATAYISGHNVVYTSRQIRQEVQNNYTLYDQFSSLTSLP